MTRIDLTQFSWLNESQARFEKDTLIIDAPAKTDFFCNEGFVSETGVSPDNLSNAPFLYQEVEGDFIMHVEVSHPFADLYDAAVLMVMENESLWAKACFENTDLGTKAVVSVVTNQTSDDANGPTIEQDTVWLQVARVGPAFSFHYSLDGNQFDMMRVFNLPVSSIVKVGLVAQAPDGQGGPRFFKNFLLEKRTVKNLREGK
ncbi:DUF1349 domain-containing protein [Marinilactibacillus sp. GCM10026970]|uniref:DUF1349 domain-containing protein n=1 Tax=Marinilactibacillus sp. GCM10026970 TaxID=3252642 RepID=UPI003612E0C6